MHVDDILTTIYYGGQYMSFNKQLIYLLDYVVDEHIKLIEENIELKKQLALAQATNPNLDCFEVFKLFEEAQFTPEKFIKMHREDASRFHYDKILAGKKKIRQGRKDLNREINGESTKKRGRPMSEDEIIDLIVQTFEENPFLSPEKMHEQFVNLNIIDAPAPNTIAKYLAQLIGTSPGGKLARAQTWMTFMLNHGVWSMDFCVIPSLMFKHLFVLLIMSHDRRKIEHVAVTEHPNISWVKQQIREATPYGHQPKYLVHDNDKIFNNEQFKVYLEHLEIESVRTAYKSPWQNCYSERAIGTLRRELFDHIIPLNAAHLQKLLRTYVNHYYNPHRTHQGIGKETPIKSPTLKPSIAKHTKLIAKPVLNGLYHTYEKIA